MSEDSIKAGGVGSKASLATCPNGSVESDLKHVDVGGFLSIKNGERSYSRHQREIPVCADQADLSESIVLVTEVTCPTSVFSTLRTATQKRRNLQSARHGHPTALESSWWYRRLGWFSGVQ
jgi:hypothetical protein